MLGQKNAPPLKPLYFGVRTRAGARLGVPPPPPLAFAAPARPAPTLTLGARAYFERAAMAARGAPQPGTAPAPRPAAGPAVYRAGDPALRVFEAVDLGVPDDAILRGAIVTLVGARDSVRERLLYDLSTSRLRAGPPAESADGTAMRFSRSEAARHYRRLLASLRYFNWSDRPMPGERRIVAEIIDEAGERRRVAERGLTVIESAKPRGGLATAAGYVPPQPPPLVSMSTAAAMVVGNGKPLFGTDSGRYALHWWRPAPAVAAPVRASSAPKLRAAPAGGAIFSTGARYRVFVSGPGGGRPQAPAQNQRPGARPVSTLADRAPPSWPGNDAPPLDLSQLFGSDEAPRPGTAWRGRAA
jgi:hypothetical protein